MRWVAFDYGEVISKPTVALDALAAKLGVGPEHFRGAYWACRDLYDRGQDDLDYWQSVGALVGVDVSPVLARELTDVDHVGWLHADRESVALVAELAAEGVPLALLSNAPRSFAPMARRQKWFEHFRVAVFSGEHGIAKPDPAIWALLVRQLGASPSDCVFLDDREVNVEGAEAAGLTGVLWRGGAAAGRKELARLGFLSS
jgi:putative hydrolase of the HAD superfamily